jgi:hypothetical protein
VEPDEIPRCASSSRAMRRLWSAARRSTFPACKKFTERNKRAVDSRFQMVLWFAE